MSEETTQGFNPATFDPADDSKFVSKFAPVKSDDLPTFTLVKKGGYLEDEVDNVISSLFEEKFPKLVQYHNSTVEAYKRLHTAYDAQKETIENLQADLADAHSNTATEADPEEIRRLSNENATLNETIANLKSSTEHLRATNENLKAENDELRKRLAIAEREAEEAKAAEPEPYKSEAVQATALLENAQKLADQVIADARKEGEAIHARLADEARDAIAEAKRLENRKRALFDTLVSFHESALSELKSNSDFASTDEEETEGADSTEATPDVITPVEGNVETNPIEEDESGIED